MSDSEQDSNEAGSSDLRMLRMEARGTLMDLDHIQAGDLGKHLYSAAIMSQQKNSAVKANWTSWPMDQAPAPRDSSSAEDALFDALDYTFAREIAQRIRTENDLEMCLDPAALSDAAKIDLKDALDVLLNHKSSKALVAWKNIPASGRAKERLERLFDENTLRKLGDPDSSD